MLLPEQGENHCRFEGSQCLGRLTIGDVGLRQFRSGIGIKGSATGTVVERTGTRRSPPQFRFENLNRLGGIAGFSQGAGVGDRGFAGNCFVGDAAILLKQFQTPSCIAAEGINLCGTDENVP